MTDVTIADAAKNGADARKSPGLPTVSGSVDILASRDSFEHMQRVAKVFCTSDLIPAHLKKNNGADALLALQIAKRMNEDPVSVMQNIYFVSGKAGWSASYMIARANRSGVFKGPIRWKTTGEGDAMVVTARGRLAEIEGEDVETSVSMKMAKAEGWTKNPKYNTMAEHMLRWRSATMLIRLYCPEVMMGMPTDDELTDQRFAGSLRDVTGEGHVTTASQVSGILSGETQEATTETTGTAAVEHDAKTGEIIERDAEQEIVAEAINLVPDGVGQEEIAGKIVALINAAKTMAEVTDITNANAERMKKWSQGNRAKVTVAADDKLEDLQRL